MTTITEALTNVISIQQRLEKEATDTATDVQALAEHLGAMRDGINTAIDRMLAVLNDFGAGRQKAIADTIGEPQQIAAE